MELDLNTILYYLTSPEIQQKLAGVKLGFLIVGGIFLVVTIFSICKSHYFQWLFMQDFAQFVTFRGFSTKKINQVWQKTLRRLESGSESEYKLAVVEADKILDNSLKRMGLMGKTLEERLGKLTATALPSIDDVYEAHKISNSIVRDPDFRLTLAQARKILDAYRQAFDTLDVLS